MFFESKNFESIQGDYFKVVFRPVNPDEITTFYYGKVKNMAKALSIMMTSSPEVAALNQRESRKLPASTSEPASRDADTDS
jgi:hypothetical protein